MTKQIDGNSQYRKNESEGGWAEWNVGKLSLLLVVCLFYFSSAAHFFLLARSVSRGRGNTSPQIRGEEWNKTWRQARKYIVFFSIPQQLQLNWCWLPHFSSRFFSARWDEKMRWKTDRTFAQTHTHSALPLSGLRRLEWKFIILGECVCVRVKFLSRL